MYGYDYLVHIMPAILLILFAQYKVKKAYSEYSKIDSGTGMTGAEVAESILRSHGLNDVRINRVSGNLTDHYNPQTRELNLSDGVYSKRSIASLGIAAHEVGHAIQHQEGYSPLKLRSVLIPMANIGSNFGIYMVIMGMIFSRVLVDVGIIFFAASVAFTIITLPVEFDASRRAQIELENYMSQEALAGSRKVLSAAALTYVASTVMAVLQLLRLLNISRDR
ncbi:MAG: zinc metallopeptidase [Peptoniphilus sp.]|uniref:zinc metallopeptidase n=1 Tax=Peptoniphilus sp. TaxID=1971214 RepID=UPI002A757C7F|nr:zinc metallopeptidase [Peptoniphilus sp.]MDY2986226.1 zinc metallopeptidase [Peptoniphilus sp.]